MSDRRSSRVSKSSQTTNRCRERHSDREYSLAQARSAGEEHESHGPTLEYHWTSTMCAYALLEHWHTLGYVRMLQWKTRTMQDGKAPLPAERCWWYKGAPAPEQVQHPRVQVNSFCLDSHTILLLLQCSKVNIARGSGLSVP